MKYIDSEKLIAGIKHLQEKFPVATYEALYYLITSLQQEQPSLPSNLDDAAKEFAHNYDMGACDGIAQDCFKAGAEWQREQSAPTCKSCGFYENNCPFIRDTFKPYPNKVCKDYTYSVMKKKEQTEDEHGKELLYVCRKTAEREHRSGVREGKAQAEKELIPLINRLCEAILFEWKDAADLARKILTQIKAREE